MRDGLPRPVVRLLTGCFVVASVGLLSWLAYFVLRPAGVVVAQVGAMGGLWLTAGLSAAVALTSGLLAFHYRREAYGAGEEVLFRTCLIVSTGVLIWSGGGALSVAVLG